MKNETENSGLGVPKKEQVIETVIDIFVRKIGFIERKDVSSTTHIVKDFYIDSDDLSFCRSGRKTLWHQKATL